MTRVTDLDIDPDLKDLMLKGVDVKDRRTNVCVEKKDIVWRKRNLKNFITDTPLDPVAVLWNNLSDANKALWDTAGSHCGMTGYRLFVQDTTYRIQNNLAGVATPNNNRQYKVIEVVLGDEGQHFYFEQHHSASYYLRQFRAGSKKAYDWVTVSETITAPIKIEFDYFADLEWVGDPVDFGVYVKFYGVKNGSPSSDWFWWDLTLSTNWTRFSQEVSPDLDTITHYYIDIEGSIVSGVFRFDNVNLEHDAQNWAIDPNCDSLDSIMFISGGYSEFPWLTNCHEECDSCGSVYIS